MLQQQSNTSCVCSSLKSSHPIPWIENRAMSVPIVTLVGRCAVTSPDAATRWRRRRSHSGGFATREWFPTPETRDARKTGRTLMRTSRFRSNRWLVAAATVVSLTALTACGSSDGDSNSDPNAIVVAPPTSPNPRRSPTSTPKHCVSTGSMCPRRSTSAAARRTFRHSRTVHQCHSGLHGKSPAVLGSRQHGHQLR